MTESQSRLSRATIVLHWLIAAGVVFMLGLGLTFDSLDDGPAKDARVSVHISVGTALFALGLIRLWWRLKNGFPPAMTVPPRWQRIAARISHSILLAAPIYMPIVGILFALGEGYAIDPFGVEIVAAGPERDALAELGHSLHGPGGFFIMLTLAVHIAAALKHQFVDRDGTLARMLGRTVAPRA